MKACVALLVLAAILVPAPAFAAGMVQADAGYKTTRDNSELTGGGYALVSDSPGTKIDRDAAWVYIVGGDDKDSECVKSGECFMPSNVTIGIGDKVVWFNNDRLTHTVHGGSFEATDREGPAGTILPAGTYSFAYDAAGTFPYYCQIHPWKSGIVTVSDAPVALDTAYDPDAIQVHIIGGSDSESECAKSGNCFIPSTVPVDEGGTVQWFNRDSQPHTIHGGTLNAVDGDGPAGFVKPGESYSFTYEKAGTFSYYCQIHPWKVGGVVVHESDVEQIESVVINPAAHWIDVIGGVTHDDSCIASNDCYFPSNVTITAGDEVVWFNGDNALHMVTAGTPQGMQDGPKAMLKPGSAYSFTYNEIGEHPYFCIIHPWKTGVVHVTDGDGSIAGPKQLTATTAFAGMQGKGISEITANAPVQITITITNNGDSESDFVLLSQIRSSNGATVDITQTESRLEPGAKISLSTSWTPAAAGPYIIDSFVWDSLESMMPLAEANTVLLSVG